MAMRVTDRLVAPPRGTPEQAMAYAGRAGAGRLEEVRAYVAEVYRLAPLLGIDPAIVVAQSAHETGGWRSPIWQKRLNPAGIGVTDGPDYGYGFSTGVEAARAQLVHLAAYALGLPLPPALAPYAALDPRLNAIPIPWLGSVRTIADLAGTWATDVNYAAGICRWGNAIFPGIPDQETSNMERQPAPVIRHILPASAPNRPGTRYGQKLDTSRGPLFITIHETGNPGSTAWAEIDYLRSPEQQQRQASFHLAVDANQIVQGLPLDEVGWHAGDGCDNLVIDTGCFRSIAIETCISATSHEEDLRIRRTLAECIARICAGHPAFDWGSGITRGRFDIDHLAQHNWFSDEGKNCPARIRNEGFWPVLMQWVDEAWVVWGHGQSPVPGPAPAPAPAGGEYAPRRKPPKWTGRDVVRNGVRWRAVQRVVEAIRETPRYQYASPRAPRVGPPIKAGEAFVIAWLVENRHGRWYVTPSGTRVRAADCTPEIVMTDQEAA